MVDEIFMNSPYHPYVSNIEGLSESITSDYQVGRWFVYLVTRPDVKSDLIKDPNISFLYPKLNACLQKQGFLCLLTLCFLLFIVVTGQYPLIWLSFVFFLVHWRLNSLKTEIVKQIGIVMLTNDYPEKEICKKTLYQISEHYSRKYNIPSLVDVIFSYDVIARKSVYFLVLFSLFVLVFQSWQVMWAGVTITVGYFAIMSLVNLSVIYKNLR